MSYEDLKHMPKVELHCHLNWPSGVHLAGMGLEKGMDVARGGF